MHEIALSCAPRRRIGNEWVWPPLSRREGSLRHARRRCLIFFVNAVRGAGRRRVRSARHHLRELPEMPIGSAQNQSVLNDEGRDSEVVRRNGGALPAKLKIEPGIVMRRLFVGQEDGDPGTAQEPLQVGGVGRLPIACCKAGPKLAQHDEWDGNGACGADDFDPLRLPRMKSL